jgi:hypothetical protein
MKEYKYGKGSISPGLSGKTGPIVMLLTVLVFSCALITVGGVKSIGGLLILPAVYSIAIFGFSWWPIIKCDKESLYLEFLGWPIKIPWEDVLSVQEIRYFPQKAWLVTAKKITPLHYLYSLLLSFKLVPGFVIWESISNRGELLSHIRRNIKTS